MSSDESTESKIQKVKALARTAGEPFKDMMDSRYPTKDPDAAESPDDRFTRIMETSDAWH